MVLYKPKKTVYDKGSGMCNSARTEDFAKEFFI